VGPRAVLDTVKRIILSLRRESKPRTLRKEVEKLKVNAKSSLSLTKHRTLKRCRRVEV
jgi:hypothetical protein